MFIKTSLWGMKMLKNILKKRSLLIVAIIILLSALWVGIFKTINSPKNNEICYLFVTGDIDNELCEAYLLEKTDFKKIVIFECFENDRNYDLLLQTNGLINSDLLIISEEVISLPGAKNSFVAFDDLTLNEFSLYQIDDKNYGIKLTNNDTDKIHFLHDDHNYYLVVNDKTKKDQMLALLEDLLAFLKKPNS